jgi:uncharacterized protein (TIGR01244 family)
MKLFHLTVLGCASLMMIGCSLSLTVYETDDHDGERYHDGAMSEVNTIDPIDPPTIHREGRLMFSAQPDENTIQELADSGMTTVINFRRDIEMEKYVPFDEAEAIAGTGASYVHIPLGGGINDEPGYDPEDVDRLAAVLESAKGDVLLHCASGGRARTIWTAYLVKYEGLSEAEAITRAQKVGQQPSSLDRLLGKEHSYVAPVEEDEG